MHIFAGKPVKISLHYGIKKNGYFELSRSNEIGRQVRCS